MSCLVITMVLSTIYLLFIYYLFIYYFFLFFPVSPYQDYNHFSSRYVMCEQLKSRQDKASGRDEGTGVDIYSMYKSLVTYFGNPSQQFQL